MSSGHVGFILEERCSAKIMERSKADKHTLGGTYITDKASGRIKKVSGKKSLFVPRKDDYAMHIHSLRHT